MAKSDQIKAEQEATNLQKEQDVRWMQEAIRLAETAEALGETPIGAVIVRDGQFLCGSYNLRETNRMATAHAELLAIEEACRILGGWRLPRCTLYVTMEPCPMCAGAIVNARIERVVYGAKNHKAGCCGSLVDFNTCGFNHTFALEGGVSEDECRRLLQRFFAKKREEAKQLRDSCVTSRPTDEKGSMDDKEEVQP